MAAIIITYGWIVFSVLDKAVHPGYSQSSWWLPRLGENVRQQGWAVLSGSAPWSQRLAIQQVSMAPQPQLATHLSSPSSPSFCGLSTTTPWDGEDPSGLLHYLRHSPVTAHLRYVIVPHQHLVQPPMLVVSGKQDGFLPTQKNDQQL